MANPDIAKNLEAVLDNERKEEAKLSFAEKLSQKFAKLTGTTGFAVFHIFWFITWIAFNSTSLAFDKYPFTFLTLIVSLEAIFLTITLLISQNFLTRTQDRRAALDLQINLLAERENTVTVRLLRKIADKLGVEIDEEEQRMAKNVDACEVLELIEQNEKEA